MMLAGVEEHLRDMLRALSPEARSALTWAAVLLPFSCLVVGVETVSTRIFTRPRASGKGGDEICGQELRLRRMVMNDTAKARRLIALEITRGASGWAAAAERAADRLERDRSR